jgi:hypothetical protein
MADEGGLVPGRGVIPAKGAVQFIWHEKRGRSYLNGKPCKYLNDTPGE